MANSPTARKRVRQAEGRRLHNRAYRSRMRTAVKQLRAVIASGDATQARELLPGTLSVVDVTAAKGAIHGNAADRTKSRLTRAVQSLAS